MPFYVLPDLLMPDIQTHQRQAEHNHRQRHAGIAQEPDLQSVYASYRELEYQSRRSRYECASFTNEEIQLLTEHVQTIRELVAELVDEQ